MDLAAIYRRYLDALNERRFDDLDAFVRPTLTYNGASWTVDDYRALLVDDVRQIPDLRFTIATLVVDADHVACRLAFDCHPTGRFHGLDADGRRVRFAEHVFYRFDDGRIADVHSLLDTAAIREQLADPDGTR